MKSSDSTKIYRNVRRQDIKQNARENIDEYLNFLYFLYLNKKIFLSYETYKFRVTQRNLILPTT